MSEEITEIRVCAKMILCIFMATLSQILLRWTAAVQPGHSLFILNCWTSNKRTTTTWSGSLSLHLNLILSEEETELFLFLQGIIIFITLSHYTIKHIALNVCVHSWKQMWKVQLLLLWVEENIFCILSVLQININCFWKDYLNFHVLMEMSESRC